MWRLPLAGGEETREPALEGITNRYWEGSSKGIYFVRAAKPTPLKLGVYFALPDKPAALEFFSFATGTTAVLKRIRCSHRQFIEVFRFHLIPVACFTCKVSGIDRT